jgi:hypothetical protein
MLRLSTTGAPAAWFMGGLAFVMINSLAVGDERTWVAAAALARLRIAI